MEQNFNSAFSINSSSGLITVSDASKIKGKVVQQDTLINLIIRTTDSGEGYELDTAKIWVKENAYCKFIDYSYSGTENGTRVQPYNDLDDVEKTPGYGYFIKRGVRFSQGATRIKGHMATASNPTIFGAYGTGERPTFDGRGQGHCFYFGENANPETDKVENVKFYDIAIKRYPNCAWKIQRKSSFLGWYNCVSDSNAFKYSEAQLIINTSNYLDSVNYLPNELINCTFNRTIDDPAVDENSSLIKCGNGPLTTVNCYFSNSVHASWRATCGRGSSLKHSIIENSGIKGIQIRDNNITIEDVRIINSAQDAIEITGNTTGNYYMPNGTTIKNCFIKQGGSEASIIVREPSSTFQICHNTTIENCLLENGNIGIQSNDSYSMQIRKNKISGFSSYPIRIYTNYSNKVFNPAITYNVIYNSGALVVEDGMGAKIYNNTVDGEINLTGSSGSMVRNNYFQSLTNAGTESNNLDIDTINVANHFLNYPTHDYRLKSTAHSSINKGYNVSLTSDIAGTNIPQGNGPDIGAYEYRDGTTSNISIQRNHQKGIRIYPNPTTGTVHIRFDNFPEKIYQSEWLIVTDLFGHSLFQKHAEAFNGNMVKIDLSGFPKGFYLVGFGDRIKEKLVLQ
ncbi:MAG: hypothetical protein A2W92_18675 [Bacteroidetes bacterium GWA2_42_15]|nr:MAG: hypothetical protein A2W92_18675 [Bacteroidetes bacterium GWA2_42_15]